MADHPELSAWPHRYLTLNVQNFTIGWHIFRSVTEGMFLATYGIAFNTAVVQVFWSMSVGSVLMYFLQRGTWLVWRESMCVWANVTYGIITVFKILHLVDRLPNENHYMFKHCFLTMADAALCQTPVHKQYVVQFAEAIIRVVVWRRYNVLADTPTWGVVAISLAWQLWLVTFSSMLQARHVSAFRSQRATAAAAGGSSPAPVLIAPAVSSSPPASARSSLSAAVVASRPASCEIQPTGAAPGVRAGPRAVRRSSRSPRSSIGAASVAAGGGGGSSAAGTPSAVDGLRLSCVSSASSSQKRFMRALRSVARGPSSYVLLSHQRRQSGGPQCASAQFYIPTANPDMLSGNWRERLSTAIAEGAPGWQVAGVCVRKGSLIVHLDLVYAPTGATAVAAATAAAAGSVPPAVTVSGRGEGCFPGVSYSEQPFDVAAGCSPKDVLDDYMGGMGAESLLELLGLPPDLPEAEPLNHHTHNHLTQPSISLQMGDQLRNLLPASAREPPVPAALDATTTTTSDPKAEAAAPASAAAAAAAPKARPSAVAGAAAPETWRRLVVQPLRTALLPPAELRSREYAAFLSERVGRMHVAYASFICLAVVLFYLVQGGARGVNPLSLAMFASAELFSLAAHAALGGAASPAWRASRAGVVYAGVAARTLQMLACTGGLLPRVLRDSDCISGRWIQKVLLITTLQALCMQPPVRTFFLVRGPSVLLSMYVHVFVCRTRIAPGVAVVLHLGWEGLLLLISAHFQMRHLEAFRRRQRRSLSSRSCCQELDDAPEAAAAASTAAASASSECEPLLSGAPALPSSLEQPGSKDAAAVDSAVDAATAAMGAASADSEQDGKPTSGPPPAAAAAGFVPVAASGDPYDVSVSAPLVVMAPRRAARLQLHFTCAPAVVEELQVVLRHLNPAAMSSGVHDAHAVRDITRALVAPAGAAAAPPHTPASFSLELTLVASPADMPGLVHVELWRGRRRLTSHPVLLVAAPEAPPPPPPPQAAAAAIAADAAAACGGGTWLQDVATYVGGLREQGHSSAADQFVEELGTWLAQAAALERGLTTAASGGGGGAAAGGSPARVANVLYFHGYGSEFMYLKPRRVSGGGAAAAAPAAADPLRDPLCQLLLVQGSVLLAVAVEAGCVALSCHLMGVMVGQMGATVGGLLGSARTPVTQLPLLHAAVKSGDARMVDLVAEWSSGCGVENIWAAEAAILTVSLESCASNAAAEEDNNTASLESNPAVHGAAGGGFVAAAAARRHSRSPQQPATAASAFASATASASAAGDRLETIPSPDVDADADADGDDLLGLTYVYGDDAKDLSEESPFRIIDFRTSNRIATAAGTAEAAGAAASGGLGSGRCISGGLGSGRCIGGGDGGACSRSSLDSVLVDNGVLVLTPLHMSLALGDEGRLATHILRTYPEAYELWRRSQLNMNMGLDSNAGGGGGSMRLERGSSAGDYLIPEASGASGGSGILGGIPLGSQAAVVAAFSSLPGLVGRLKVSGRGAGGGGGGGSGILGEDSMEAGSLQSMSLSEVAFFEGIRWVDEDTTARRPGVKITRM
ncbi:hypothetical protein PLESTM_001694600 [Pleodorina starrii]|nr:hypothetical protein PLESTM_001694600 [Pleodorina starrii]